MKDIDILKIYGWGLLTILLLIVVHAPITSIVGGLLPEYDNVFRAWKEITLAGLAVLAVIELTRRKLWTMLLHDPLILLSLTFIDIHLLLAVTIGGDANSIIAGLMIDLRFIVMFMLMYVLGLLRPDILPQVVRVVAIGAAAVIGFGLLQIAVLPDDVLRYIGYSPETIAPYITIDSNPDFVRINSTLRGPNPLGAVMVIYGALALAYLVRRHHQIDIRRKAVATATAVASGVVLFASFSRSAYVAFAAALVIVAISARRISKKVVVGGLGALIVTAGLLALVSSTDWFSNVVLHEDPESPAISKSNDEHAASLAEGARRTVVQPFGAGVGSTGSATLYDKDVTNDIIIENYYFFVAHESGWFGLGVFSALFAAILFKLWQRRSGWLALGLFASGIGLALIGLLLPVWTDDTVALVWWGLAGVILGRPQSIIGGIHGRTTRKQKTARTT